MKKVLLCCLAIPLISLCQESKSFYKQINASTPVRISKIAVSAVALPFLSYYLVRKFISNKGSFDQLSVEWRAYDRVGWGEALSRWTGKGIELFIPSYLIYYGLSTIFTEVAALTKKESGAAEEKI